VQTPLGCEVCINRNITLTPSSHWLIELVLGGVCNFDYLLFISAGSPERLLCESRGREGLAQAYVSDGWGTDGHGDEVEIVTRSLI
jgi:hypothetical protein